jgi:drug/metabolite transporter (DMT)-like permease
MLISFAILAACLSAAFFVGGKVAIARHGMAWSALWRWSLLTTGACGLVVWLAIGAPSLSWSAWGFCLLAGITGSLAHVCANQALAWGDASVLVPVSGAKPLVMVPLLWLVFGTSMPPNMMWACALATFGIALGGLGPVRRHVHAPHPRWGFALMLGSVVLMTLSDFYGTKALKIAGPELRTAVIAGWCMSLGLLPLLTWWTTARSETLTNRLRAVGQGVIFAAFIAALSLAITFGKTFHTDPGLAVSEVNIIVAFRGVIAVVMVLALDRWMGTGLEPLPWWIHGIRLLGALVLAGAVMTAFW